MTDDQITDKGYPDLPSGWYDVQVSAGTDVQADTLREGWQTELSWLQLLASSFPAQRFEAMRLLVRSLFFHLLYPYLITQRRLAGLWRSIDRNRPT